MPAVVPYNDPGHNLPTVDHIRTRWCFGLPLYAKSNTLWTRAGEVMKDPDIQSFIDSAVKEVERFLGVYLKPTIIKCTHTVYSQQLVEGVDFDLSEPPYDYYYDQYSNWGFMQTREYPFISVEGLKMALPNNQAAIDFAHPATGGLPPNPASWIKINGEVGQVRIVPYSGGSAVLAAGLGTSSMFLGSFSRNLPQALCLDYTAGFATGKVPPDIVNVVAKIAACDLLGIASEALLAGVASVSTGIDGLSQSYTTTASAENMTYGAHIIQYRKDVDSFFNVSGGGGDIRNGSARTYYKGFNFTVL